MKMRTVFVRPGEYDWYPQDYIFIRREASLPDGSWVPVCYGMCMHLVWNDNAVRDMSRETREILGPLKQPHLMLINFSLIYIDEAAYTAIKETWEHANA